MHQLAENITDQIQSIVADIKEESCVVIIGPDIVDFGKKTFFETMLESFKSHTSHRHEIIESTPEYIFTNEELLQLKPTAKETTLLRMMENFYKEQKAFDDPLTKISQIPFHLIISLMPDDRLKGLFSNQGLDVSYSHYPREGPIEAVERPQKGKPLIYNIMGDFEWLDVIITFDHLFSFLTGIMGKRELPQAIQEALKKTRTFVFLGVHFEKWYVQLLLRIITSKEKKDKYTILKNDGHHDICTFIARRLEVDFLETDPQQFLNELYLECGKQGILRNVNTRFKARIFISYSSKDAVMAEKIQKSFSESQIEVIRDETSSNPGQKIEAFINTIKASNGMLLIVSKDSLQSIWVSKEIITTLQSNKLFIPCYIDKSFLDAQYWKEVEENIMVKLNHIGQQMIGRGTDSIDDLLPERNDLIEMKKNLPVIREALSRGICKPVTPDDYENTVEQIIRYIIDNAKGNT